jgi:hypothetical protein
MKQQEITVNGKNYPVVFTLATLSNFEEITGKPFFKADIDLIKNRIAIICAAAIAADENTELTVEDLRGKETFDDYKQIVAAFNTVMELANDFFAVPGVEPKPEQPAEEKTDGEGVKN